MQLVSKCQARIHPQPGCLTASVSTLPSTFWPWCPEWVTLGKRYYFPQPWGRRWAWGARDPSSQFSRREQCCPLPEGAGQCCHFPGGP